MSDQNESNFESHEFREVESRFLLETLWQSIERPQNPSESQSADPFWAHEGAPCRKVEFKKQYLRFDDAIDVEKIEALLAWSKQR